MRGFEYGEQDRKAAILYEYETFKAIKGEQLLDTYHRYLQVINDLKKYGYKKDNCELNYKFLNNLQQEWKQYATLMRQTKNLMDINIDALYNILKQNQGYVNDALGYKKNTVVVHSDPLSLVVKKTNVSKRKEKVVVSSDSEGSGLDDFRIGFENPSYFEKAKDLRPTLYDEKVIGLWYILMFLTHSNEALEIEKFKRSRENKIEFAYDYGNPNASYVNEKINFEDDYFQEITNPDFEKIDSPLQQKSSLKPYVLNVILEKIIIDLEDEVVNLLEKEKVNLETIESLK
nr:hypothetical protein [Tanacetum cinerariifolium]